MDRIDFARLIDPTTRRAAAELQVRAIGWCYLYVYAGSTLIVHTLPIYVCELVRKQDQLMPCR